MKIFNYIKEHINLKHLELYCKSDESPINFVNLYEALNQKVINMKLDYIKIDIEYDYLEVEKINENVETNYLKY